MKAADTTVSAAFLSGLVEMISAPLSQLLEAEYREGVGLVTNILEEISIANRKFVENLPLEFVSTSPLSVKPNRRLVLFTCMDTRLVSFLEPAIGISRGEAKVIKNAGNSITSSFDSTIRSLIVAIFELDVEEILVIGHRNCGMAETNSRELISRMTERGIHMAAIKVVEEELEKWVDQFYHPEDNVEKVVARIRSSPFIPRDVPVHGLIFDPHTGEIKIVVNGYENL